MKLVLAAKESSNESREMKGSITWTFVYVCNCCCGCGWQCYSGCAVFVISRKLDWKCRNGLGNLWSTFGFDWFSAVLSAGSVMSSLYGFHQRLLYQPSTSGRGPQSALTLESMVAVWIPETKESYHHFLITSINSVSASLTLFLFLVRDRDFLLDTMSSSISNVVVLRHKTGKLEIEFNLASIIALIETRSWSIRFSIRQFTWANIKHTFIVVFPINYIYIYIY